MIADERRFADGCEVEFTNEFSFFNKILVYQHVIVYYRFTIPVDGLLACPIHGQNWFSEAGNFSSLCSQNEIKYRNASTPQRVSVLPVNIHGSEVSELRCNRKPEFT